MQRLRPVTAVKCFETTDGKQFDTDKKQEAMEHQRELNRISKLKEVLAGFWEERATVNSITELATYISNNREAVRKAIR